MLIPTQDEERGFVKTRLKALLMWPVALVLWLLIVPGRLFETDEATVLVIGIGIGFGLAVILIAFGIFPQPSFR